MGKIKILIILILVILLAGGCNKQVFNGSRTGDDTKFAMSYSVLNRTEVHEMKLSEGTSVDVAIDNQGGRLDVVVKDSEDKEIYKANDADSAKFTLKIPKTSTYKFYVKGEKAKGSVSFVASGK